MDQVHATVAFTPESVQKAVIDAIINSSLGASITKSVQDFKTKLNADYQFRNAIDTAIQDVINQQIREELTKPENIERVRQAVQAKLTDEVLEVVVNKTYDNLLRGGRGF